MFHFNRQNFTQLIHCYCLSTHFSPTICRHINNFSTASKTKSQELTQFNPRSHPKHPMGKFNIKLVTTKDIISDSHMNSNFSLYVTSNALVISRKDTSISPCVEKYNLFHISTNNMSSVRRKAMNIKINLRICHCCLMALTQKVYC